MWTCKAHQIHSIHSIKWIEIIKSIKYWMTNEKKFHVLPVQSENKIVPDYIFIQVLEKSQILF